MIVFILHVLLILNENILAADVEEFYRVKISDDLPPSDFMIYENYNTTLAVDGRNNTCTIPSYEWAYNKYWLRIDLDRIYTITHIILFYHRFLDNGQANLHTLKVRISNESTDFSHYQLCTSLETRTAQVKGSYTLSCEKRIPGKFIGLFDVSLDAVCEIQVFADWKTVNLAFQRPYRFNTLFPDEQVELAFDGDPSTCSSMSTSNIGPTWLSISLDYFYYVTHVNIIYKAIHEGIDVFVSISDQNYEEALCATTARLPQENTTETQFLKCKRPLEGLHVTIKKHKQSYGFSFVICELEVYTRDFPREMSNKISPFCLPQEYQCAKGRRCIHMSWLCDGTNDCPSGDDEAPCKVESNHFKCKRRNESIPIASRCDGEYQCSDHSDEEECFDAELVVLKATFKGEKGFYVCYDKWSPYISSAICSEKNRDHLKTNEMKKYRQMNKFLKLIDHPFIVKGRVPSMDIFEKSSTCKWDLIVAVDCILKKDLVETCGKRGIADALLGPYIIKGLDAEPGAWPWNVQIIIGTDSETVYCGGSLIRERWVLTTAHCLSKVKNVKDIIIKLGTIINNDKFVNPIPVTHFIQHPNYKENSNNDNIALLRLNSNLPHSKFIKPICLPDKPMNNPSFLSYQYCVTTGFGHILGFFGNRSTPLKLQQTRMNIFDNKKCADMLPPLFPENGIVKKLNRDEIYQRLIQSNEFCAGTLPFESGPNSCVGDGGSALVCKFKDGTWQQAGIATYSYIHSNTKDCQHSAFVKVYPYLDFIYTVMAQEFVDVVSKFGGLFKNYFDILPFLLLVNILKHY